MPPASRLVGPSERASERAMRPTITRAWMTRTPPSCDDLDAPYDLAALLEGHLSPEGIQRLARHLKQCRTCRTLVVMIVAEAVPARGTGVHAAVPGPDEPEQI